MNYGGEQGPGERFFRDVLPWILIVIVVLALVVLGISGH